MQWAMILLTGTIADAKEGEEHLRRTARMTTAAAAIVEEVNDLAPHYHSEGIRNLRLAQVRMARGMAVELLAEARTAEAAAIGAAAVVTAAAHRAVGVRQALASNVTSLWRHCARRCLSAEGVAGLDLAVASVAGATTALTEMRDLAARKLDWARWSVLAAERRVRRLQREERCIVGAHQLWEEGEIEYWAVLAAAAAAAAVEVDGGDEADGESRHGGTDPGNDHGGGSAAKNGGSRGESEHGDGSRLEGGPADKTDDGGGTGGGAGRGACGEWIGDGGGWRVSASTVKGKMREEKEDGVRGGRRRRGARRKRERGWRRWLRRREPTRGYLGRTGGTTILKSLCLPTVVVSRTGMGEPLAPSRLPVSKTGVCCVDRPEVAILSHTLADLNKT